MRVRAADWRATILVVDDSPDNLTLMNGLLQDVYRVQAVNSGAKALRTGVRRFLWWMTHPTTSRS